VLGVFGEFTLDKDAGVAEEFNRLVKEKGWSNRQTKSEQKWCFGRAEGKKVRIIVDSDLNNDNNSKRETGSDHGTDSNWDFVSIARSESGLSDYSVISSNGGIILNGRPDPITTLSGTFEQLAIRHANAAKVLSKTIGPMPKAPKQLDTQRSKAGKSKKKRHAEALETDFRAFFGSDLNKLEGWQKLCEIVGLSTEIKSVTHCKKVRHISDFFSLANDTQALQKVHINLVNLVQHCRNPEAIPLMKFESHKEFRDYTMRGKSKIFPKAAAKNNAFLKALLKRIY
jgi:hypothetical protein